MAKTTVRGEQITDATVSLTADIKDVLPIANGGTGTSSTTTLPRVLIYSAGWPDRPADSRPTIFVGGTAPTDAPTDVDLAAGDMWVPSTETRVGTTTSSATPSINTDLYDQFNITALAANITSMTTGLSGTAVDGQKLLIRFTGTATRTITWGASFQSGAATLLATTSGTNTHMVGLIYDAVKAKWVCMAVDATGY